jgi:hypothetical protein
MSFSRPDPSFDVGDRVRAAEALGGFFRAKVATGTPGVVISRHAAEGKLTVRFINGHTVIVGAERLTPLDPPDPPDA